MSVASPSENRRPRALVTGLAGFTGQYVAAELEAAGYEVVGFSHGGASRPDCYPVDLTDRDAVADAVAWADADIVIHLAAIAFVAHGDAEAIYRVNVLGTRNLLEALATAARKPELVLLASSANIYGNAEAEPITESTPPSPQNDYAVSKLSMEYMARLWADRLPIVIARPFNYTGVGQGENFLLPKIIKHFREGAAVIELGNIDVWRDFIDVRQVASAYRRLVEKRPIGGVFNICSGHAYSLREVIEMTEELAGRRIEVRVNPAFVRANEVKRLVGSNQLLLDAIGPMQVIPLKETLRWMLSA
jgi:nucleoside-diphosphate-sugar epimerase